MKRDIPPPLLLSLREGIATHMGLHFAAESAGELQTKLRSACAEAGIEDISAFLHDLLSSPVWSQSQIALLARQFTVGETYFFREPQSLEVLAETIFPETVAECLRQKTPLRIWSAGCATGEEAYSLAISLHRRSGLTSQYVKILATDINPIFLQKASTGIYGEWSFRGTPEWLRQYFVKTARGLWQILPVLQKMVDFKYLNLAEDSYPLPFTNTQDMDLILCRNVLMYFTPAQAGRVVEKFYQALRDGGFLIVSASEAAQPIFAGFTPVYFPEATFYQKKERSPRKT